jgi:hypothetical protein
VIDFDFQAIVRLECALNEIMRHLSIALWIGCPEVGTVPCNVVGERARSSPTLVRL